MKRLYAIVPLILALGLTSTFPGLATAQTDQANVPLELRVPDGYKRVLVSVGRGVQIYDCVAGTWQFREPAAAIIHERADRVVAIHYRGPTWQSVRDGSQVVGAVKARRDAPKPQRDIPWLLLQATSTSGPGLFGQVQYIQRLDTEGGVAPPGSCTPGQSASVPYQATYAFWAAR